jgi:hypothetical protein
MGYCAVPSGRSLPDVLEVLAASIIREMMEAASTSETSVNFYQTARRNNPENSDLHTQCEILEVSLIADVIKYTMSAEC